jgi:hypothetical protein
MPVAAFPRTACEVLLTKHMPSVTSDTPDDPLDTDLTYEELVWRRNLFAAIAALLLVVVIATGVLDVATSVHDDRTFSVGAAPRLIVHDGVGGGLRGGIGVRAGDAGHIRVEGEVHGTWRVRYAIEQRGDDVVIEAQPRFLLGWLSLLGPARFTITAPATTRLEIESYSAPIDVQRVAGGGTLQTTNGAIHLDGVKGGLSAVTTNGAINTRGFDGSATLRTTNGAIDVREGRGTFDVTTTNGAIMLDAELQSGARHRAETTNGSVTVHLRGEPSLRVNARTTNGAVVANRPITTRERSSDTLAGTIGAGDGELSLRTTNGKITID